MERIDRARELMERARRMGIRLQMDKRLMFLTVSPSTSGEATRTFITDAVPKYLPELREILEGQQTGIRAKQLVGCPIFSIERGEGTLVDASDDGKVVISIDRGFSSNQTQVSEDVRNLVILLEDSSAGESPASIESVPRKSALRGILDTLGGFSSSKRER